MDNLDFKLISLLREDATQTSEVLAKQLGVSSSTVRARIKRLLKQGVFRIIAYLDPDKMGTPLRAIIALDVAFDKINEATEQLSKFPEVKYILVTSGRYDVMMIVWCTSTEALFKFISEQLSKVEGIKNTETFISMHVRKRLAGGISV